VKTTTSRSTKKATKKAKAKKPKTKPAKKVTPTKPKVVKPKYKPPTTPDDLDIEYMPIDKIVIGWQARTKKNCGDIKAYARAIDKSTTEKFNGQLQMVVLNSKNVVVDKYPLLLALKELRRTHAWVVRLPHLDDPVAAAQAQLDEHDYFVPLRARDRYKLIDKMDSILKKQAKERQKLSQAKSGQKVGTQGGRQELPPSAGSSGKVDDQIGAATGESASTVRKRKKIGKAADADDLHDRLDAGESVNSVHADVQARQGKKDGAALAPEAKVEVEVQDQVQTPQPVKGLVAEAEDRLLWLEANIPNMQLDPESPETAEFVGLMAEVGGILTTKSRPVLKAFTA
jgi:hypothetical protein